MKQPTKEQIREAAEECPEAQVVLRRLFPDAFVDEWRDITKEIAWKIDGRDSWDKRPGGFLRGDYKGEHLMTASEQRFEVSPLSRHYGSPDFKVECNADRHTIWTKE